MIEPQNCEIEVLFGSVARRDSDRASDIDILIADESIMRLRARKEWLKIRGFSVSDYTWSRLSKLFANKTMFASHLKLEGKTIHDSNGRYAELLLSFEPATSYAKCFSDSLSLFSIFDKVPASNLGRLWALDHLTVAFRNSAILFLANEGEFVFSLREILHHLRSRNRIGNEGIAALSRARIAKRAYRESRNHIVTASDLSIALRAADQALKMGFGSTEISEPCIANNVSSLNSTGAYLYLRTLERELISAPVARTAEAQALKSHLLGIVRAPHDYLWQPIYARQELERKSTDLRASYA